MLFICELAYSVMRNLISIQWALHNKVSYYAIALPSEFNQAYHIRDMETPRDLKVWLRLFS